MALSLSSRIHTSELPSVTTIILDEERMQSDYKILIIGIDYRNPDVNAKAKVWCMLVSYMHCVKLKSMYLRQAAVGMLTRTGN